MSRSPFWRDPFVADPPKEDAFEVWGTVSVHHSVLRRGDVPPEEPSLWPWWGRRPLEGETLQLFLVRLAAEVTETPYPVYIVHPLPDHDRL